MGSKDTFFYRNSTLKCGDQLIDLATPAVMGILNVTPDSFYNDSRFTAEAQVLKRAESILSEGGKIIDIGAESTRPGSAFISEEEEYSRLIPAIQLIKRTFPDALISADTSKSTIAREAVFAGAGIINDISGGSFDPAMFETVASLHVPYILMHLKETPATMQQNPHYENIFEEVALYFAGKINRLRELGVADIILDPGFGFAKNTRHNYELLQRLEDFKIFNLPILAGISRKRMINSVIGSTPDTALNGTTVANTISLLKGVPILRVHDVKEAVEAVKIVTFVQNTSR